MSQKETVEPTIQHECDYYLAFDIETTGLPDEIIAIGVSVVCKHGEEFDSKRFRSFVPGETAFEAKCLDEFWMPLVRKSKHKTINGFMTERFCPLQKLGDKRRTIEYPASGRFKRAMFESFFGFLKKWQTIEAEKESKVKNVFICSDNPTFDAGVINEVARKVGFLPHHEYKELPFNQATKEWKPIICVDSFMMSANSLMLGPPGMSIISLFDQRKEMMNCFAIYGHSKTKLIERRETTDHLPEDDAYNIAYDIAMTMYTLCCYKEKKN